MSAFAGSSNHARERSLRAGLAEVLMAVRVPPVPPKSLYRRKAQHHPVHVSLARVEPGRRELRVVRRIGKNLRFQAQAVALAVDSSALADRGAVDEVA